ncbi:hypothetical protein SAMCFNEI73_pA0169 (plasmid) [Sinorhizobium americanum]|uniref:Uncharacterized protein n=1 Tax=Sinorhizobium americanum TaxID=194963 RepID=A0A1L3LSS7_9HYPH|nr:hypothetical protein SAMCFNEI73_pA0169 [Sinorhizobium americanum]
MIPFTEPPTSDPSTDSFPSLIGQFELPWSACFPLDNDRAVAHPSGNCNIGN